MWCASRRAIEGRAFLGLWPPAKHKLAQRQAATKCMPSGLLYTATISVFAATRLASRPLLAGPALRQSRGCRLMASVSGVVYAQAHLAASHAPTHAA